MSRSKKFLNVKMGTTVSNGNIGPQTFPQNTVWVSQLIPCRGAKCVLWTLKATDVNGLASAPGVNCSSGLTSTLFAGGSKGYVTVGDISGTAMTGTGLQYAGGAPTNLGVFYMDYITASVASNVTNPHTNFVVDVEVFYDGDADDTRQSVGQGTAQPL